MSYWSKMPESEVKKTQRKRIRFDDSEVIEIEKKDKVNGVKVEKKVEVNSVSHKYLSNKNFQCARVLNDYPEKCSITVLGKFKESLEDTVFILKKLPFNVNTINDAITNLSNERVEFTNDIYCNFSATLPKTCNEVQVNRIHPADEKTIQKYEKQNALMFEESPFMYTHYVIPYIEKLENLEWVENILEHKTESERIVCEDADPLTGFILLPDMKWTGNQTEDLYMMAIVNRKDLTSIRDLTADHLPLLHNIYFKCTEAIESKYGVKSNMLRIYLHYHPTFYHLHVHFSALSYEAPGINTGKAHMLTDLIDHLTRDPFYYVYATMSVVLKETHPLALEYVKPECIEKALKAKEKKAEVAKEYVAQMEQNAKKPDLRTKLMETRPDLKNDFLMRQIQLQNRELVKRMKLSSIILEGTKVTSMKPKAKPKKAKKIEVITSN